MTSNITTAAVKSADPLDGDFSYYAEKAPSDLHELHAALVTQLTGIEVTPKQVQVILGMHGKIQASENNRKRAGYKPRTVDSIRRGGDTTAERAAKLLAEVEAAEAAQAAAAQLPNDGVHAIVKAGRKFNVVEVATDEVLFTGTKAKANQFYADLA